MKLATLACIAFVLLAVSCLAPTKAEDACNPMDLQTCAGAIQTGAQPSTECCGKLKEQQTCLCGYMKNPAFSQYITPEKAHQILAACDIPYPSCN
ncbi:unnamed protein product [Cochlearia groenlandica]